MRDNAHLTMIQEMENRYRMVTTPDTVTKHQFGDTRTKRKKLLYHGLVYGDLFSLLLYVTTTQGITSLSEDQWVWGEIRLIYELNELIHQEEPHRNGGQTIVWEEVSRNKHTTSYYYELVQDLMYFNSDERSIPQMDSETNVLYRYGLEMIRTINEINTEKHNA